MNLLDLLLAGLLVTAAVGGYRLGLLTRVVSWGAMGAGLFLAARTLPWLLERISDAPPETILLVGGLTLLGGAFLGQAVGVLVGSSIQLRLPGSGLRRTDHVLGAVAGLLGVVVSVWLLLPAMSDVPGFFAEQSRRSVIARTIDARLPPPPDTLQALRSLVGEGQFPQVFAALTPAPDIGPPPSDPGLPAEVIARVTPSTVKVTGVACRRVQEGSGFVTLGRDVIVTNAHVVAGEDAVQVERDDGELVDAFPVVFDPNRDVAVLRAPGLDRNPLTVLDGGPGMSGGVFGRPGGAPLRVAPFAIADEVKALGTDIYDQRRTERDVLVLASSLRPGDSGSALVDGNGSVIGVAFAIAPDDPGVAYALDTSELRAALQGSDLVTRVDTGPCLR